MGWRSDSFNHWGSSKYSTRLTSSVMGMTVICWSRHRVLPDFYSCENLYMEVNLRYDTSRKALEIIIIKKSSVLLKLPDFLENNAGLNFLRLHFPCHII